MGWESNPREVNQDREDPSADAFNRTTALLRYNSGLRGDAALETELELGSLAYFHEDQINEYLVRLAPTVTLGASGPLSGRVSAELSRFREKAFDLRQRIPDRSQEGWAYELGTGFTRDLGHERQLELSLGARYDDFDHIQQDHATYASEGEFRYPLGSHAVFVTGLRGNLLAYRGRLADQEVSLTNERLTILSAVPFAGLDYDWGHGWTLESRAALVYDSDLTNGFYDAIGIDGNMELKWEAGIYQWRGIVELEARDFQNRPANASNRDRKLNFLTATLATEAAIKLRDHVKVVGSIQWRGQAVNADERAGDNELNNFSNFVVQAGFQVEL